MSMARRGSSALSIEKTQVKAFICKIFGFERLTYAQK
jgi:hypothetical protein